MSVLLADQLTKELWEGATPVARAQALAILKRSVDIKKKAKVVAYKVSDANAEKQLAIPEA